jgi:hypothetical protein
MARHIKEIFPQAGKGRAQFMKNHSQKTPGEVFVLFSRGRMDRGCILLSFSAKQSHLRAQPWSWNGRQGGGRREG